MIVKFTLLKKIISIFRIGNVMFIKSLPPTCKQSLISKFSTTLNLNCNQKKMSTLENVIDGLRDVKNRIQLAIQKRKQVIIIYF